MSEIERYGTHEVLKVYSNNGSLRLIFITSRIDSMYLAIEMKTVLTQQTTGLRVIPNDQVYSWYDKIIDFI